MSGIDVPKSEDAMKNFKKSKNMLKGYFKALYDNAGMDWTEENNEEIDYIVNSIYLMAVNTSGNVLIDAFTPGNKKNTI
jgi:hypothetical protein